MTDEEEEIQEPVPVGQAVSELIEGCLNTWLQQQGGGFVTAFTICVEYVDSDGDHCWTPGQPPSQTFSQTLGLLRWHTLMCETQGQQYLERLID